MSMPYIPKNLVTPPAWRETWIVTYWDYSENDDGDPRIYYGISHDDATRYADGLVKSGYHQQVHVSKVVYENV